MKRAHDAPEPDDDRCVLLGRLWPRGLGKQQAHVDGWLQPITPSDYLRPRRPQQRGAEFATRHRTELADEEHRQGFGHPRELREAGPVTSRTGVKDLAHSHIPVLLARSGAELP
ncbi:DUF488 domain-containing protein [Nocardia vaccinii]|uniref:DUF488 domain-containing protein n=1 Tax=Nocardia vaccinii TaxID=1822 RepID=UPI001FE23E94|nr:DUF488 domain-containing protein [Nocardia vaccinii]